MAPRKLRVRYDPLAVRNGIQGLIESNTAISEGFCAMIFMFMLCICLRANTVHAVGLRTGEAGRPELSTVVLCLRQWIEQKMSPSDRGQCLRIALGNWYARLNCARNYESMNGPPS